MLETDKKILGEKFKKYRKDKSLTQFQLSEKVGLNEKQISRIEAGQNYPTYMTFAKLIEVLDVNITDFSTDSKKEKTRLQEDLLRLVKNSNEKELQIYLDVIKTLKKNLKNFQTQSL